MFNMKNVTAREFQHNFSALTAKPRAGEEIQITKRGKLHGTFRKAGKFKMPDFLANLKGAGYSVKDGDRILKEFYDSLS